MAPGPCGRPTGLGRRVERPSGVWPQLCHAYLNNSFFVTRTRRGSSREKARNPAESLALARLHPSRQDTQGFYENPTLDDLVKYADFEHARSVLEFGCGTGSFARRLSETDLPVKAHYLGLDMKSPPYRQERRAGDQAQRHTASRSQEQSGVNAREAPTTWQAVRSFWRFGGCCFRSSIRKDRSTLEDNEATLES
jgi:SAM-dependent methyltransferase